MRLRAVGCTRPYTLGCQHSVSVSEGVEGKPTRLRARIELYGSFVQFEAI
jgi:hypothetical protein